jgi:hypothetical protein
MNMRQLKDLLKQLVPQTVTCFVVSPPGCGKTMGVQQLAADINYDVASSHPGTDDPTDYKGIPSVQQGENFGVYALLGQMAELVKTDKKTIWFLDDVHLALPSVQGALMQWLDRNSRVLNGVVLPDNISIVMAGNDIPHKAGATGFLEPFKQRCGFIAHLDTDLEVWVSDFAIPTHISHEIIAYLEWRPQMFLAFEPSMDLKTSPNPRAWEHLDKLFKCNVPDNLRSEVFQSVVGEAAATEFVGFLNIYKQLPSFNKIRSDPKNAKLPHNSSAAYAVTVALASSANANNLPQHMTYMERLDDEFIRLWTTVLDKYWPEVTETSEYVTWAVKHQDKMVT